MANGIKLFQLDRQHFEALGFYAWPSLPSNQTCRLNRKNLYYIFIVAGMLIPVVGFGIFKAHSVYEYGITIYTIITLFVVIFYYGVLIFGMAKILNLIAHYEDFIAQRK